MDLALITEIVQVLLQLVAAAEKYGPDLVANLEKAFQLATSTTPITDADRTQIREALTAGVVATQQKAQAALDDPAGV